MFYGRREELEALDGLWGKAASSFVVCSGRRRVGKSTLVEAFASNVRNGQGFVTAWKNANSTTSGMNACAIDCSGNPHRFWYWDERTGTPVWTSKTKGTGAWPNE